MHRAQAATAAASADTIGSPAQRAGVSEAKTDEQTKNVDGIKVRGVM